jgi:predicted nucleic acid-binding Zn ribbon protein
MPAAGLPVRDGSRDTSAAANQADHRTCPGCGGPLPSARARSCSAACRQRVYRARHAGLAAAMATAAGSRHTAAGGVGFLAGPVTARTVYECTDCTQRFVGQQRCPDCQRFCRKLGLGGACPGCDEPLLLTELLGLEVTV